MDFAIGQKGEMMNDTIYRQDAIDAVAEGLKRTFVEYRDVAEKMLNKVPSAEPEWKKGEWIPEDDLISRKDAIYAVAELASSMSVCLSVDECHGMKRMQGMAVRVLDKLPPAQPEIIRCNACKHWDQSTGKMKGYGLGKCDFHDADLVTCNGFCYWAERRR